MTVTVTYLIVIGDGQTSAADGSAQISELLERYAHVISVPMIPRHRSVQAGMAV